MRNGTSIGLDVHARSGVGCAIDGENGEIFRLLAISCGLSS